MAPSTIPRRTPRRTSPTASAARSSSANARGYRDDPDDGFNEWTRWGFFASNGDPSGNTDRPQGLMFEVPRINANLYYGDYPLLPPGNATNTDYKDWLNNIPLFKEFGQWGFHSQHPGGANFLMGDGSVKLIKDSVDLATYRALGTRKGGEVTSADSY